MREATAYVRARKGPAFVHARCIRPYSHSLSDDEKLYKPPAEREAEAKRDPIVRFTEFLKENGLATDDEVAAMAATKPAKSSCEMWLYSPDVDPTASAFETPANPEGKPDTMLEVINHTLKDEMAHNPRIIV